MDNKELLAVLDMSEEGQWRWLTDPDREDFWPHISIFIERREWYLADLAFRLRDEVKYIHRCSFVRAVLLVFSHYFKKKPQDDTLWRWFSREANPIHWIIAALIAKNHNQRKD